jgi:signal transduction histidine kinase
LFPSALKSGWLEARVFKDKRVLAIDDSVAIRNYLRALLTRSGAGVDVASTGQEGLAMCTGDEVYNLILLDLILPDMNGIDVLKRIREVDDETTVVILTGSGGVQSAIATVRHGADAYVEKQDIGAGSDPAEFFYTLEQAAEHRAGLVAQKQLQQVKADFYSMVTHDLRGPTGNIRSSVEMLLDGAAGPLTPDQTELLEIAQWSADKMFNLINNYLDFAKIDAGYLRLDLGEVELRGMVETSAHMARLQAQAKDQTLSLDLPPDPVAAWADAGRFQQVLDNLLSNAVKYTPEGGRVSVQLRVQAGQAVFRVSDTGMGIPPAQLPALFTKYHRVPGEATRGIRGTGLGLLIVKEIVEAHGGTVRAESEGVPGQGTTFTVSIPLGPALEGR